MVTNNEINRDALLNVKLWFN